MGHVLSFETGKQSENVYDARLPRRLEVLKQFGWLGLSYTSHSSCDGGIQYLMSELTLHTSKAKSLLLLLASLLFTVAGVYLAQDLSLIHI